MPRFVVLRHETPASFGRPSHWDFMFEAGDHLRCWALVSLPSSPGEQWAEALGDHRLAYLDYEGPVSRDRGEVRRQDEGECDLLLDADNEVVVRLQGKRLSGILTLRREVNNDLRWRLSFEPKE